MGEAYILCTLSSNHLLYQNALHAHNLSRLWQVFLWSVYWSGIFLRGLSHHLNTVCVSVYWSMSVCIIYFLKQQNRAQFHQDQHTYKHSIQSFPASLYCYYEQINCLVVRCTLCMAYSNPRAMLPVSYLNYEGGYILHNLYHPARLPVSSQIPTQQVIRTFIVRKMPPFVTTPAR